MAVASSRREYARAYWAHRARWIDVHGGGAARLRRAGLAIQLVIVAANGMAAADRRVAWSPSGMVAIRRRLHPMCGLAMMLAVWVAVIVAALPLAGILVLAAAPFPVSITWVGAVAVGAVAVCLVALFAGLAVPGRPLGDRVAVVPYMLKRRCWIDAMALRGANAGSHIGPVPGMIREVLGSVPSRDPILFAAVDERRLATYQRMFPDTLQVGRLSVYRPGHA